MQRNVVAPTSSSSRKERHSTEPFYNCKTGTNFGQDRDLNHEHPTDYPRRAFIPRDHDNFGHQRSVNKLATICKLILKHLQVFQILSTRSKMKRICEPKVEFCQHVGDFFTPAVSISPHTHPLSFSFSLSHTHARTHAHARTYFICTSSYFFLPHLLIWPLKSSYLVMQVYNHHISLSLSF